MYTTSFIYNVENNQKNIIIYDWDNFLKFYYLDIPSKYRAFESIHHFLITEKETHIIMQTLSNIVDEQLILKFNL